MNNAFTEFGRAMRNFERIRAEQYATRYSPAQNFQQRFRNAKNRYIRAANNLIRFFPVAFPNRPNPNTRFISNTNARRVQAAERIFRNRRRTIRAQAAAISALVRRGLNRNTARRIVGYENFH